MVEDDIVRGGSADRRTTELLFAQFPISSEYARIQEQMYELLVENRHASQDRIDELKTRFSGSLYEELAFFTLSEVAEPQVLLSPKETLKYFQQYLYPHTPTVVHEFADSLDGISVPDGLLLTVDENASVPNGTYEYTLRQGEDSTANYDYFRHKYRAHKWRQREFGDLFKGTPLVFVTPQQPGLAKQIKAVGNGDVRVVELPFGHKAFRKYADTLLAPLFIDAGIPRERARTQYYRD